MRPCRDIINTLLPAYPCHNFKGPCLSMVWAPQSGHVPRGFLGATSRVEDVELVLVFAEPGDPHDGETHSGLESAVAHTYSCMRSGQDQFHRNVRQILDMCFPDLTFDQQLEKAWLTESVLCSARKECGSVPSSAWRACSLDYLKPQLSRFSGAVVAALGAKASARLDAIGIPHIKAKAAAPPGCNQRDAFESWKAIADAVRGMPEG